MENNKSTIKGNIVQFQRSNGVARDDSVADDDFKQLLQDRGVGHADHLHQRLHGHEDILGRVVVGTLGHPGQQLVDLSKEKLADIITLKATKTQLIALLPPPPHRQSP